VKINVLTSYDRRSKKNSKFPDFHFQISAEMIDLPPDTFFATAAK
jgi:hypothetical protein